MNSLPSSSEDKAFYYKMVAKVGERYYSIFDARVEYKIGKVLYQEAQADHQGGYYVYKTMEEASMADVPRSRGGLYFARRVLLICMCWGTKQNYDNGKVSFSYICPVKIAPLPEGYISTKEAKREIEKTITKNKIEKTKFTDFLKNTKFVTRPKTSDQYKANATKPLADILKSENDQLEDSIARMENNLRRIREANMQRA